MKLTNFAADKGVAAVVLAGAVLAQSSSHAIAEATSNDVGSLNAPTDYHRWVFIGSWLTPNALNDGKALFREFHNVYADPSAFDRFTKTVEWANGKQIAEGLAMVPESGNCAEEDVYFEVPGNGYFQGEFVELELTVKVLELFADEPDSWVYFDIEYDGEPHAKTAQVFRFDPATSVRRQC